MLTRRPIFTEPNVTHYEWAGTTLRRLLGAARPVAETWAFFSGPRQPARIIGADGLTMADLVRRHPEVLGPAGADPANRGQKYFFVKFLDPSDFPPFAYVGLNPRTVRGKPAVFRREFAELLWQDRELLEHLAALFRARVTSPTRFAQLKRAYKAWAILQARDDWAGRAVLDPRPFAAKQDAPRVRALLSRQRLIRRVITRCLHRIDFQPDQAILIKSPTIHAIAGLSLQLHPNTRANRFPKDELWIYKEVALPKGRTGWVLVEPQRTFDKTEAGADFFTPFAWTGAGLGFRKRITRAHLRRFVALMDAIPRLKEYYLRRARPIALGRAHGRAQWRRVVEESGWPFFAVRELRFQGAGEATMPLGHRSFIELHVTRGEVQVMLARGRQRCRVRVSPRRPVFLPATLPYDTITYRARTPATLHWFSR